jgi:regulator of sigma E protease
MAIFALHFFIRYMFYLLAINWPQVGVQVAQFFLALSILIVLHEFGHYITAKMFKCRVEKFYLFFDFLFPFSNVLPFSIFKKKKGETEYGIGWFPLGGYVKIAGMVDESNDKEFLNQPPQPWEFRSKPAWQRLIIMLGGIIVNLLLAFVIYYFVIINWGVQKTRMDSLSHGIVADNLATQMGIKTGDKILSINNKPIIYFEDLNKELLFNGMGKNIELVRDGKTMNFTIPENLLCQMIEGRKRKRILDMRLPFVINQAMAGGAGAAAGLQKNDVINQFNGQSVQFFDEVTDGLSKNANKQITLGYLRNGQQLSGTCTLGSDSKLNVETIGKEYDELEKQNYLKQDKWNYNVFNAFGATGTLISKTLSDYLGQFKLMFQPKTCAYKGLGGFKALGSIFPVQWDWRAFWSLTAFLSVVLAFMNLLPIPGLDGGYVLFTLVEMITRRKIPDSFMEKANMVGLVLLLALMLYANLNDWIGWGK